MGARKFEFSLERLLQVKQQLERQAELEQLRARRVLDEACAQVQQVRDQLQRLAEQAAAGVGRLLTAQQWAMTAEMSDRLARLLQEAESRLTEAQAHYQQAARRRAQLATEVEALQTLRRQQWQQWRQDMQKAEQERLDELGLRRWQASAPRTSGLCEQI